MKIAKNTKKAKAALTSAKNVRCYSKGNDFSGAPMAEHPLVYVGESYPRQLVKVSQAEFMAEELSDRNAFLYQAIDGNYKIRIHTNLWYEFEASL